MPYCKSPCYIIVDGFLYNYLLTRESISLDTLIITYKCDDFYE